MTSRCTLDLTKLSAHDAAYLDLQSDKAVVTTPPSAWNYAASCPVPLSEGPVIVTVRLLVQNSPIGLGVLAADGSTFIDEIVLQPGAAFRDVALELDGIPGGARLQIRTAEMARSATVTIAHLTVELLDDKDFIDLERTLFAFYDIDSLPISFDFIWFLAAAEVNMKSLGLDHIYLIIVRGRHGGVNAIKGAYDEVIDTSGRIWRLENVVLPSVHLFPAITGYALIGSRREALLWLQRAIHTYPERSKISTHPLSATYKYVMAARTQFSATGPRASVQGLRYVDAWLERIASERRPVVMTLRQYRWLPERNNDLAAWSAFARRCEAQGFAPIFVPDTDQAMEVPAWELAEFPVFAEASWNLGLRMAIYERAFVNMFPSTGPSTLCMLSSKCPYLLFKILIPDYRETDATLLEERGIAIGKQLPFAAPYQRITWREDLFSDLAEEFDQFVGMFGNGL